MLAGKIACVFMKYPFCLQLMLLVSSILLQMKEHYISIIREPVFHFAIICSKCILRLRIAPLAGLQQAEFSGGKRL